MAFTHTGTYSAENPRHPESRPRGKPVTQSTPVDEAAVAQVLETRVDQIRAKARADHADELQHAGYPEAANYLRNHG